MKKRKSKLPEKIKINYKTKIFIHEEVKDIDDNFAEIEEHIENLADKLNELIDYLQAHAKPEKRNEQ